jgi:hypothetical protein
MGIKWSQPASASSTRNSNARTYETPDKGDKTKVAWCKWMQKWWQPDGAFNANNDLGSVYPGKTKFVKEMLLLEKYLNSAVKQGVCCIPPAAREMEIKANPGCCSGSRGPGLLERET